jgi:hypothetical protein
LKSSPNSKDNNTKATLIALSLYLFYQGSNKRTKITLNQKASNNNNNNDAKLFMRTTMKNKLCLTPTPFRYQDIVSYRCTQGGRGGG